MFNRDRLYYVLRERGCLEPGSHIIEMLTLGRHLWCRATPEHLRPDLTKMYAEKGEPR